MFVILFHKDGDPEPLFGGPSFDVQMRPSCQVLIIDCTAISPHNLRSSSLEH